MREDNIMKEYAILDKLITKIRAKDTLPSQHNLGAVVVDKKGNPIAYGFNSYTKTHPMQKFYNEGIREEALYLHAEISALIRCVNSNKNAYAMIIARVGRGGKILLAKPCKGCYNAISSTNLVKVFYTNSFGELVLLDRDIAVEDYQIHDHY